MEFAMVDSEESFIGVVCEGVTMVVGMVEYDRAPEGERDNPLYWFRRWQTGEFEDEENYPSTYATQGNKRCYFVSDFVGDFPVAQEVKHFLIDDVEDEDKPEIELVGQDGDSGSIIGRVCQAWRREGRSDIAKEFAERAISGSYNNILVMVMNEYSRSGSVWGEDEYNDYEEEN
jgi:hypothetical protein